MDVDKCYFTNLLLQEPTMTGRMRHGSVRRRTSRFGRSICRWWNGVVGAATGLFSLVGKTEEEEKKNGKKQKINDGGAPGGC